MEERVLVPGSIVAGKLRVIRLLGEGGMGAVYEVEHELTKHRRALKILHARIAHSPTVVGRFLREASAAARIGNPHIAETFDAGRLESGEPYLLMELLEGETLDARLGRTGPLDAGEVAELVYQACEGIIAAHDAGIVHRDLKPENLFLTSRDGYAFVKVLDFGISKFESRRAGVLGVTAEGTVMGTPFYMPPEQVRGEASIDSRADIYSLGVILYECSCGVRPYEANALEHLAVLIHEGKALPLSERRPSLPAAFCDVVRRAMSVDRDRRYSTARELADALAPFRARTVGMLRASASPRVVIRPSSPPAGGEGVVAATAMLSSPVTATAMADTLQTDPPSRRATRSWSSWAFVAGVVAVLVVGATLTVGRRSSPPVTAGAIAAPIDPPLPASGAAALSTLSPIASPIASASLDAHDASVSRAVSSARPAASAVGPAASGAPTVAAPTAASPSPSSKSRVDQSGLAGENPFR